MKIPKPQKITLVLAIVSLVAGVSVFLGADVLFSIKRPVSIIQPTSIVNQIPTAINIPKIGKNLPIKVAAVHDNNWDLFSDAVAWLSTSKVPGAGNVILYAHDWQTLWGDLYLLAPGDAIYIQQNATWKRYIVTDSKAVMANDVQAVLSDKNQLTLYTCEGSFDQKRRVVYARPAD